MYGVFPVMDSGFSGLVSCYMVDANAVQLYITEAQMISLAFARFRIVGIQSMRLCRSESKPVESGSFHRFSYELYEFIEFYLAARHW